jgi:hypothetical protein
VLFLSMNVGSISLAAARARVVPLEARRSGVHKMWRMPRQSLLIACLGALLGITSCSSREKETPSSANEFFVAASGNDSNPGTLVLPFLTLRRCQIAMRNSSSGKKVCTIRAGTYSLAAPLTLTSSDDGETWQYYAPDGANSAVLDGGGVIDIAHIKGGSHITINGLKMANFRAYGIWQVGGGGLGTAGLFAVASGNTYENNDIGFNTVTSWSSAAIYCDGANPNTIIKNNYFHDLGSQGVAMNSYYFTNDSYDGSVIQNNVILRAVQRKSDGGAIYLEMFGGTQNTHVTIANNFILDYGAPGIFGATGIYLDQGSSNVTVTGNVVGPATKGSVGTGNAGAFGFQVNAGNNDHITANILDLGDSGRELIVSYWWESGPAYVNNTTNNTFEKNIVISEFAGRQKTNFTGVTGYSYYVHPRQPTNPTIQNNDYYNYAGGEIRTDGNIVGDSNPIFENPQISGWTYQISEGSPVFKRPMNFRPIDGGWGPPGFVIPRTGTAPSAR